MIFNKAHFFKYGSAKCRSSLRTIRADQILTFVHLRYSMFHNCKNTCYQTSDKSNQKIFLTDFTPQLIIFPGL